ncbi:hypothetical protein EV384_0784 [Micromonospora kangleipakensis]|uniref:Uncharacterized protein n=1 Tax=Micromonospora kangleipakensis TaxID=1077942 RepID=A0A4Q8B6A9_9ACTN|nr:hypothetical protein EV384_0784 [Micromonospora kangleipakensis]
MGTPGRERRWAAPASERGLRHAGGERAGRCVSRETSGRCGFGRGRATGGPDRRAPASRLKRPRSLIRRPTSWPRCAWRTAVASRLGAGRRPATRPIRASSARLVARTGLPTRPDPVPLTPCPGQCASDHTRRWLPGGLPARLAPSPRSPSPWAPGRALCTAVSVGPGVPPVVGREPGGPNTAPGRGASPHPDRRRADRRRTAPAGTAFHVKRRSIGARTGRWRDAGQATKELGWTERHPPRHRRGRKERGTARAERALSGSVRPPRG